MRTTDYITRSRCGRQLLMATILACLCFSPGEGLRLRPFPVGQHGEVHATRQRRPAQNLVQSIPSHQPNRLANPYSPVIAQTRSVRRDKQKFVDYESASPSFQIRRELTGPILRSRFMVEAEGVIVVLLTSRTPSRAPPSTS